MSAIVALCLIGFAAGASAQTQINIATVTSPDLVHTKAAFWFNDGAGKSIRPIIIIMEVLK
jgi:hypothetical protein